MYNVSALNFKQRFMMKTLKIDPFEVLKSLVEVTSPCLGQKFLEVICEELKSLFNADVVIITESVDFNPTTKVSILYSTQKDTIDGFELEGTPCKLVFEDKIVQIQEGLNVVFEKVIGTPFESFYGIPIHNAQKVCIGHVGIFSEQKRKVQKEVEDIALLFSQRIETEYARIILEKENEKLLKKLYALTIIDPLTNVNNRRFFENKCSEIFNQVKRKFLTASLIFLDLDNFKAINDNYGHEEGDYILKEIGNILINECREDVDFVSRVGGEEFAIISLNNDIKNAINLSQRIMQKTARFFSSKKYLVTFSVGIVDFDSSCNSWKDIYALADAKMYEAKNTGKNKIQS